MSTLYELTNLLGVLQVGRAPQWSEQVDEAAEPAYDGAPATSDSGVDLQNAVQAMVCVNLRREAHRRTCIVTPGTFDAATTYTITVSGTGITATGASLSALLTALVAAVVANGTVNALVTATVYDDDGDGTNDSVKIVGKAEADYGIGVSATSGTGTIAVTADPSTAALRLWGVGAGPNAPGRTGTSSGDPGVWAYVSAQTYALAYRGFLERFAVAGMERLYVELASVAGPASDTGSPTYTPHVWIGPCVQETDV